MTDLLPIGTRLTEVSMTIMALRNEFNIQLSVIEGTEDHPFAITGYNKSRTRYRTTLDDQGGNHFGGDRQGIQAKRLNVMEEREGTYSHAFAKLVARTDRESAFEEVKAATDAKVAEMESKAKAYLESIQASQKRFAVVDESILDTIEQQPILPLIQTGDIQL